MLFPKSVVPMALRQPVSFHFALLYEKKEVCQFQSNLTEKGLVNKGFNI